MDTARTVQTAFRFSPEMVRKMKNKARLMNISVNGYVESLIDADMKSGEDAYERLALQLAGKRMPEQVSREIASLSRFKDLVSEEDIRKDERLAYILGK